MARKGFGWLRHWSREGTGFTADVRIGQNSTFLGGIRVLGETKRACGCCRVNARVRLDALR
jgi:hypothetical protein